MMIEEIAVSEVLGQVAFAARREGEAHHLGLRKQVESSEADVVALSLAGVEFMSSSWFLAALWPFWGTDARSLPVMANAGEQTRDELKVAMDAARAVVWHVITSPDGEIVEAAIVGQLDSPFANTLKELERRGEATAADLQAGERGIGLTAWSNRLAALHRQRLVARRKEGRQLVYSVPWRRRDNG